MDLQLGKLVNELTISTNAETSNINKLPNKVLTLILAQLPYADRLNCTLVCKKWNQLISESPELLNNTKLTLLAEYGTDSSDAARFKFLDFSITRNYQLVAVCLGHFIGSDHQVAALFNDLIKFAVHIKVLHFCHIPGRFAVMICQLLTLCSSLEGFHMETDAGDMTDIAIEVESIKLPSLSELLVHASYDWIFKFIDCKELDRLKITHTPGKNLIDFINNLERLETFELFQLGNLQYEIEPQFKWTMLVVGACNGCNSEFIDDPASFKRIEKLFSSSAEDSDVVLENCELYPKLFAFLMVATSGKVHNCDISFNGINLGDICELKHAFRDVQPVQHVRTLAIHDKTELKHADQIYLRPGWLDWLFKLFPNAEKFYISANLLCVMDPATFADLFNNLKKFCVINQSNDNELEKLQRLQFPNIKTMMFLSCGCNGISVRRCMKKFAKINPTLQTLKFNDGRGIRSFRASHLPRSLT